MVFTCQDGGWEPKQGICRQTFIVDVKECIINLIFEDTKEFAATRELRDLEPSFKSGPIIECRTESDIFGRINSAYHGACKFRKSFFNANNVRFELSAVIENQSFTALIRGLYASNAENVRNSDARKSTPMLASRW